MADPVLPVVGVSVIVFQDATAQTVLLIKRGKEPLLGYWSPPGGRVEAGETIAAAARREVREECGIEITLPDAPTLTTYDRIAHTPDGGLLYHYVLIVVVGIATPNAVPTAGDDAAACRWIALAALASVDPQVENLTDAIALAQSRLFLA